MNRLTPLRPAELRSLRELDSAIDAADKVEETNPGMYMQSTYAREDFGRAAADKRKTLLSMAERLVNIESVLAFAESRTWPLRSLDPDELMRQCYDHGWRSPLEKDPDDAK